MARSDTAVVFDVQRFSIHDGPGIRTVIFFKGCAMDCVWCQNPEAVQAAPELAYYPERCLVGCIDCVTACPEVALRQHIDDRVDWARCTVCGKCVDVCPADALRVVGREWTVDDLLVEVSRDHRFFDASGGGITLSGGEPVLHSAFLQEFLPMARLRGLHIALETAGLYPFALLAPLLPLVDLVLFDLKVMDTSTHQRLTAQDNEQIHANLRALCAAGPPLDVRMPVVPDTNTDDANVAATARFLAELDVRQLTLLPYNHLWEAKLPRLRTARRPLGLTPPEPAFYAELSARFAAHGVAAHC